MEEKILSNITDSFFKNYESDKKITALYKKIRDGTATYDDAGNFAVRVGNNLAKAYKSNLELELMDYDSALYYLDAPLRNNYKLISDYSIKTQNILNKKFGINVNSLAPDLNVDRIEGLAKAISEAETETGMMELFSESIINFGQNIVDDAIEKNASFDADLGFQPQIIRTYEGPHRQHTNHKDGGEVVDCEWCLDLAGTYDYSEVKASGTDIYKRHDGCRCTLTYIPSKGNKKAMNRSGNAFIR